MTGATPSPEAVLARAQRRMLLNRTSELLFRCLLALSTLAVVVAAAYRAWAGRLPSQGYWWSALAVLALAWIAWSVLRFPKKIEAARRLDVLARFKDRFVTYLDFKAAGAPTPAQTVSLQQNSREIARLDVARCFPLHAPQRLIWLLVPAVCFMNLWMFDQFLRPPFVKDPALEKTLTAKAEELKKLSEALKKEAEARKIDELTRVAEEMRRAANEVKPQPGQSAEEMRKNALLEWSRLEAKLSELSKAGADEAAAADLKELAATLDQDPATAGLAQMLKQQNLAGAMQALQSLMEQAQNDPAAAQQLREMAQKMGQSQMSSEELAQMMKQMREAAANQQSSEQMQKAMQSFSQMLSQMEKGKQQGRMAMTGLNAMRMMKSDMMGKGPQQMGMGMKGDKGDQEGRTPGRGEGEAQNKDGRGIGSETVENIFGDKTRIDALKTPAKVEGQIGEGRSFENVMRGAGENATSTVEYRELFNQYTPEAEEAIYEESIPLGSKYYIKRYFESIRPQQ